MVAYAPTVSNSQQSNYIHYLKNIDRILGDPKLTSITSRAIAEYKTKRRNEWAKPSTINRELYMISKAFKIAINGWEWFGEDKVNPVSKVSKEREDNERDQWLTHDEEKILLGKCPEWFKDIIIFDLNT